ncbi:MAG: radical SAM protein [Thermoprotei archaeon]|nr:MAG: radical SAM protein [Thermoprotei archaeon]
MIRELHSGKYLVEVEASSGIPLIGCIAYGLIDRGTNVIQIRPTSLCPLSCIFCSTDAGPKSRRRLSEYIVELDYMVEVFKKLVKYKGARDIEAHIDTVGDPLTYPRLVDLVQELSSIKGVEVVSLQTHGALLNEKILDDLDEAGLSRINLSIDSLDPDKAKLLAGTKEYDVEKVKEMAEYIARSCKMDLLIAPVWVPGINDDDIPKLIEFALKIGAGKRWPPLGIQKYVPHRHGRKPKGVRSMSWREFYSRLRALERKYSVKLVLRPEDFGIKPMRRLPIPFKVGEKVRVKIVAPGWLKGEMLGVARGLAVTLVDARGLSIGSWVKARVIRTKDNILVARPMI